MATGNVDYRVPLATAGVDIKLNWIKQAVVGSEAFLEANRAFADIEEARDIIAGAVHEKIPRSLSKVKVNRTKRQVRDIVGTLANLRPTWNFKTDNDELMKQAGVLNKMSIAWWYNTFADRAIKETLQYAATEGMGYAGLSWDSSFHTGTRGDIRIHVYGVRDVLPFMLPPDHDIQKAYAVTIRQRIPLAEAHAMFPEKAELIVASGSTDGLMRRAVKVLQSMASFQSPVLSMFNAKANTSGSGANEPWPTVVLFHTYIRDPSTNLTDKPIQMGDPGTSWSYVVPHKGQMIADGYDEDGDKKWRPANARDCKIYPFRRLMVSTETAILKDDTSPWWHARVPVVPLYFDKWPWEYLPFSLIRDVATLNSSVNTLLRVVDDSAKVRMRPPLQYDEKTIPKAIMRRFDTRQESQTIGVDMSLGGDSIKPILPPQYFDVPNWIPEYIQSLEQRGDYLVGVQDFNALARAKQVPGADTIEKMAEVVGPIVQDVGRSLEQSIRGIGELWKGLAFQFYTLKRRVQILGEEGLSQEDFDFEPGKMVPSHMPGENPKEPSRYSITVRAREHIDSFFMHIIPNSLLQITQMSRKLLILQLWRSGFPIDPWTVAEHLDLNSFGPAPKGTDDVIIKRWVAWQQMKTEQAGQAAQMLQEMGLGGGGGGGGAGGGNPKQNVGRPPTAQQAPQLKTKDGGTRTTISESG